VFFFTGDRSKWGVGGEMDGLVDADWLRSSRNRQLLLFFSLLFRAWREAA
jgi:hypothetical protein